MGVKKKTDTPPLTCYKWQLNDPEMGEYERAGLAGLAMSLSAIDAWANASWDSEVKRQALELKEFIDWTVDDIGVKLDWRDAEKTKEAFKQIFHWAWQVREEVLFMPGLHRKQAYLDNYYLRIPVHNGLLSTFLQHGKSITMPTGSSEKPKTRKDKVVNYDENKTVKINYLGINKNAELAYWKMNERFLKKGYFTPDKNIDFAAWIAPGSAPRFARQEKAWNAPVARCFLMAFAPIVCNYIKLPYSKSKGKSTSNWAYVLPKVVSLNDVKSNAIRHRATKADWPIKNKEVAGLQDGILRYLVKSSIGASAMQNKHHEVLAVVMGRVAFYANQNVRKNYLRFSPSDVNKVIGKYQYFNRAFPVIFSIRKADNNNEDNQQIYVNSSYCRERITANILDNRAWYSDLTAIPHWQSDKMRDEAPKGTSPEQYFFDYIREYERSRLNNMATDNKMFDDELERALVRDVFHKAFRHMFNEQEWAVQERGDSGIGTKTLQERWGRKVQEMRRSLNGAKTQLLCREVIIKILSDANSCRRKKGHSGGTENTGGFFIANDALWQKLWEMLDDKQNYAKVRDLALLSLVTFKEGRLSSQPKSQ